MCRTSGKRSVRGGRPRRHGLPGRHRWQRHRGRRGPRPAPRRGPGASSAPRRPCRRQGRSGSRARSRHAGPSSTDCPIRKALFSRPSAYATPISNRPIATDAAPSQNPGPSGRGGSPRTRPAGFRSTRRCPRTPRSSPSGRSYGAGAPASCRSCFWASPRTWRTALSHEMPSKTNETASTTYTISRPVSSSGLRIASDALVDGVARSEHEDPDGCEQRPEVALHAVAERMLDVGGLLTAFERRQQEDLVQGVGHRVRGFGEHGCRAGDQTTDGLGDRDGQVGDPGEQNRPGGLLGHVGLSARRR